MTVQDTTAKVREDGDGAKSVFSFPFRLFTDTDIEVSTILKSTGVPTLKVLNTDYTVQINTITEGGTVTYITTVPSALEEFFATRVVPDTQPTDIPNVGSIRESQIETPLDRRTMVSQQQQEQINRALLLAPGSTVNTISIADPVEGKGLFWQGNDLVNTTDDLNDIVADATAQAVLAAASASAAATSETNAATSASAAATAQTAAETAQTAAELAETNAETAETNAETAETNAAASAAAAAISATAALASEVAAAASATQLTGTSTTSVLIATGAKVFTTQADKFFDAGNFILITSDADPTNFMHGQVVSYVGTTLTMNITDIGGAGTFSDWTIRLSAPAGIDGTATNWLSLTDTPGTYVGQAGFVPVVNPGETALVLQAVGGTGDINQAVALMGG